jgi:hypothetical protein
MGRLELFSADQADSGSAILLNSFKPCVAINADLTAWAAKGRESNKVYLVITDEALFIRSHLACSHDAIQLN